MRAAEEYTLVIMSDRLVECEAKKKSARSNLIYNIVLYMEQLVLLTVSTL